MADRRFDAWFAHACGYSPFAYQRAFALDENLPGVVEVPTGLGKTAAAVLGWLFRRREASADVRARTPRRLVYCLPMRSLVEQVSGEASRWVEKLSAGRDEDRGELGAPLWTRPAHLAEVRALFAEGRAEIGRARASDALEFAEAASCLGVDRGVTGFVRYGLLKRRGKSFIAMTAGHVSVEERRGSDVLRTIDRPLGSFDRAHRTSGS